MTDPTLYPQIPQLQDIAVRGKAIYAARYQADFEGRYKGQFVVIDVDSEEAIVSPTPAGALLEAQRKPRKNLVYLIRIGSPVIF